MAASTASPDDRPRGGFLRSLRRLFYLVLFGGAALFALYTWAALKYSYASGERAGYVQKLSKKGWICKTWEGELAMANLPGVMPEVFRFTIRDQAVADQVFKIMGERVTLHYEQHRGVPTSCFGDTSYYVTEARRVQP